MSYDELSKQCHVPDRRPGHMEDAREAADRRLRYSGGNMTSREASVSMRDSLGVLSQRVEVLDKVVAELRAKLSPICLPCPRLQGGLPGVVANDLQSGSPVTMEINGLRLRIEAITQSLIDTTNEADV
jgi:hypothetical protein